MSTNNTTTDLPWYRAYTLHSYITMGIIGSLSVITNCIMTLLIAYHKKLRTRTNIIILSMSLSNIGLAILFIYPQYVVPYWPERLGPYCNVLEQIGSLFIASTSFHHCAVSIDRAFAINFPIKYGLYSKHLHTTILLCSVWLCALLLGFMPIFILRRITDNACINPKYVSLIDLYLYYRVFWGIVLFCPVLITIACYTDILYNINSPIRRQVYFCNSRISKTKLMQNLKTTLQMAIMIGAFIVTWSPFIIMHFYISFNKSQDITRDLLILEILRFVAFSYIIFCPILHGHYLRMIRETWLRVIRCRQNKIEGGHTSSFAQSQSGIVTYSLRSTRSDARIYAGLKAKSDSQKDPKFGSISSTNLLNKSDSKQEDKPVD
ncbi:uncharacterized protein TRIADDRAFT_51801 [Trichoplax adhaerens]|uniref:G-protein coupled receptors family 1 profile domain-containing protein n=1 Tax=Trichoplax adhaerens TaxID=10228 RepID=B3RKX6_TRIAD|nr:hypothetical protein TRIADDRAFT_51801 [Trichoplax adhaerens]EDV28662.1 hypothetical protein TRIADDRAFT_51801 [Trichoplax adhaerens]|eukprot:XP_002107864.1 hypothetical protein TRIADDRAFT_51801 [Trichoplax adhaerens]